jgi:Sugar (and other) transporter
MLCVRLKPAGHAIMSCAPAARLLLRVTAAAAATCQPSVPPSPSTRAAAGPQVIVGAVNVLSTLVAVFGVDRLGRRVLLLQAGVQMFIAEIIVAILLGHYFASAQS